jgi:nucleoside-diphosphate-sugar epimerase
MNPIIVIAGATGNLGKKIVHALLLKEIEVRIIARLSSDDENLNTFKKLGAKIYKVDMMSVEEISKVCKGATCVVSALAGLEDVIIDAQKVLLDGAIAAGVKRFIPSDYSLDFTKLPNGLNRNLDLRRAFHLDLDKSSIQATSILNGAFADMLTDQMPLILYKQKRIFIWGNPEQKMDFTSVADTALFTVQVALADSSPRYLRIAGSQLSANDIKALMTEITGTTYKMFRPGGLGLFKLLIKITKTLAPGKAELYPAWQGMQYLHNMIDGRGKLYPIDNDRYPEIKWTTVRDIITEHIESGNAFS